MGENTLNNFSNTRTVNNIMAREERGNTLGLSPCLNECFWEDPTSFIDSHTVRLKENVTSGRDKSVIPTSNTENWP